MPRKRSVGSGRDGAFGSRSDGYFDATLSAVRGMIQYQNMMRYKGITKRDPSAGDLSVDQ